METIATGLRELSLDNEELPLSVHTVVSNDDLLNEILLRLPVISLVLFKSVSKRWLSLIKDVAFIQRRSRIPNIDPPSGLFFNHNWKTNVYGFAPLDTRIRPQLEYTFKTEYGNATVLQSCNGLFLCSVMLGNRFCVCNPTINMFKMLPEPHYYKSQHGSMRMAFDPAKSPHYKVMHALPIGNYGPDLSYRIQTYSSETGIWSIVCNSTDPCRGLLYGMIYWNEAIHWIKDDFGGFMHYKLDFVNKTSVLTKTQLPVTVDNYFKLFESRGCLLLLGKDKTRSNQLNVYEMRNGHSEWSIKYSVNLWRTTLDGVWYISLGEREEDSFMVIEVNGKVGLYKFVKRTFCKLPELVSMLSNKSSTGSFLLTASFASV